MAENQDLAVNKQTGEIFETVTKLSPGTFTPEQIQLLKRTVCADASDDEFAVFLNVCKKVQLDPFAKQIYCVKYAGKMTVQTSIDGLRLIADRTGRYAPGKAPTYTYDKDGALESATAYIMKKVDDQWFEVSSTAFYKEYVNNYNQLWKKLGHVMLAKCAESNCLKKAFPNETSGLYTGEEMDQANETKKSIAMPRSKQDIERVVEPVDRSPDDPIELGDAPPPEHQEAIEKVQQIMGKPKTLSVAQQKLLFYKMNQAKCPEPALKTFIKQHFGKNHSADMTSRELDETIDWLAKLESLPNAPA